MIMMILSALVLPPNLHSNHFSVQAGKIFSSFFFKQNANKKSKFKNYSFQNFSSLNQSPDPAEKLLKEAYFLVRYSLDFLFELYHKFFFVIHHRPNFWTTYLNSTLVQICFIILLQAINLITIELFYA